MSGAALRSENEAGASPVAGNKVEAKHSLSRVLLFWFLGLSLIPLLGVSYIGYNSAYESLHEAARDSLAAMVENKTNFIDNWFSHRFIDLQSQVTNSANEKLLSDLHESYISSGLSLVDYVNSEVWYGVTGERGEDLRSFVRDYGFYDVFLIDVDGNILYTALREDDLGTNIKDGRLSNTHLAKTFRTAMATNRPCFSDLDYYGPSGDIAAGFVAKTILDDADHQQGVLAIQISMDQIREVMQQTTGLGTRGQTYLIGWTQGRGVTLRSELTRTSDAGIRVVDDTEAYLYRVVETESAIQWHQEVMEGREDNDFDSEAISIYMGPEGEEMVGAHGGIVIPSDGGEGSVHWGVVAELSEEEAFASVYSLKRVTIGLLGGTAFVVSAVALFITGRMTRPLLTLARSAQRVSQGDLTHRIEIGVENEIGAVAESFNAMLASLQNTVQEESLRTWIKTGQTELTEKIAGEHDLAALSREVITHLSKYLDAQVGVMYVMEGEHHLRLMGSYAHRARKNVATEFALGEGLVGQAALEQETIVLAEVPDDYIVVGSGLGQATPRHIVVKPIVRDGVMKAVVELGSIGAFDDRSLEFLDLVSEGIGVAVDTAVSRQTLQQLLEQSQAQSEELQVREEELRAANDEMSLKTKALEESERLLKEQRHNLQVTNEELAEKTAYLEEQTRATEQARRDLEEKAEALAMASKYKSEFLANMSHELRTPLNSLLILARSLSQNEQGNLTEDQVEAAEIIYGGGQELLTLINDILDLSKVESGKMDVYVEPVQMAVLTAELRSQFAMVAKEKKLEFVVEVEPEVPETVETDGQKVEQLLRNLLSNAFKFTRSGSVCVRVFVPESGHRYSVDQLKGVDVVGMSVTDTGIGIPKDRLDAIFESFQQADGSTSRRYGGTGLGLTISREFSRMLGGELQLESEDGKGSTFSLFIPVKWHGSVTGEQKRADSAAVATGDVEKIDGCQGGGADSVLKNDAFVADDRGRVGKDDRTVLIIEDDPRFAEHLMGMVRKKEFKCLVAGTGREGLRLAIECHPSAILLDLGLPDLDGMAVLDELKANMTTRHIPVHVISSRDIDRQALMKGAIGHLTKPVSGATVEQALDRVSELLKETAKHLLVVEDDEVARKEIVKKLAGQYVEIFEAESGMDAYAQITEKKFDCLILDLGLHDVSGFDLLEMLERDSVNVPPVIVYTGRKLTKEEEIELNRHAAAIVVKGASSPERLVDEVSLFLHSVESSLPEGQRRAIRMLHDPSEVLRGKRVLLVDDDMRNTFALSKGLEKVGMKVLFANEGQRALDILGSGEAVDLVIMDIMMPVMDGYETIQRIRSNAQWSDLPIIALTAKAMPEDRSKCLEAGANDYMTKPIDVEKLLTLMRVWMFR